MMTVYNELVVHLRILDKDQKKERRHKKNPGCGRYGDKPVQAAKPGRAQDYCLNQEYNTDVTIADRSRLKYKVLIGQNTLRQGDFLIDPKINIERRKKRR